MSSKFLETFKAYIDKLENMPAEEFAKKHEAAYCNFGPTINEFVDMMSSSVSEEDSIEYDVGSNYKVYYRFDISNYMDFVDSSNDENYSLAA